MKFDERTIKILSNYANIHPTIFFAPGQIISTMTPTKTILARAKISETIPKPFATHNLSKLLNILGLFKQPTLDIEDEQEGEVLVIKEDNRVARFTLAPPEMILKPPTKEVTFSWDVNFKLSKFVVDQLMKAASGFEHTELMFRTEGKNVLVETIDIMNPTTDRYQVVVGETNKKFQVAIKTSNFLVMSGDYDADIAFFKVKERDSGCVHLKGPDVEYFLAVEGRKLEAPRAN